MNRIPNRKRNRPIVWTVAGSDPSGGAGIQADLKVFESHGVLGASLITAMTAQNTKCVEQISPTSKNDFQKQFELLAEDLIPQCIKIGMVPSWELIAPLIEWSTDRQIPLVWDPVRKATTGEALSSQRDWTSALKTSALVTPNLPECEEILATQIKGPHDVERASKRLLEAGARSVLIKGGHREGTWSSDFYADSQRSYWLHSKRQQLPVTHGTGCALSSAIAANMALGFDSLNAVVLAKSYINQALSLGHEVSKTRWFLSHSSWKPTADHFPKMSISSEVEQSAFAQIDEPLGVYPIVDSARWAKRMCEAGAQTLQLRIKSTDHEFLRSEIHSTIESCRKAGTKLFVNDHWELAIQLGAYGVHLGQTDFPQADIGRIRSAGLRLGVSTHDFAELALATALRPSYIALGPVFPTTTKEMPFEPQGFENLKLWRQLVGAQTQLVAIGGLKKQHLKELHSAGASSAAVITDVLNHSSPEDRLRDWLAESPWAGDTDPNKKLN